jgi:hypothetical protein
MPALGMSRIATPPSAGRHFSPQFNVSRDFTPEIDREKKVVASIEGAPLHVGLFVIGRAILGARERPDRVGIQWANCAWSAIARCPIGTRFTRWLARR